MTSRERLLSALNLNKPDFVPCTFLQNRALRSKCKDEYEYIEKQLELGLDAMVLNHKNFNLSINQQIKMLNLWASPTCSQLVRFHFASF